MPLNTRISGIISCVAAVGTFVFAMISLTERACAAEPVAERYDERDSYILSEPFAESDPALGEPSLAPEWWRMLAPQRSSATLSWIGGGGSDGLGLAGLDLATSFGAPTPWMNSMFSVSPGVGIQSLDGPAGVPLPSELYRGSLTMSWMMPVNERTQFMAGLAPSFASDLEAGGSEALRFMAFASWTWQSRPTTRWTFGAAVTGREDIPVLPMVGLTWTPNENWLIEFAAPRPRIARRIYWDDPNKNDWIYLAGEFGGGTWAVDRAGVEDELTLSDFRIVCGWERKAQGAMNARIEAGYVFGRKIEYESTNFEYEPSDSVMLRAGISY